MKTFTITGFENIEKGFDPMNHRDIFTFHGPESMQVSDGYHTMDEVYDHRIGLFVAMLRVQDVLNTIAREMEKGIAHPIWKSKAHHPEDKPMFDGWFVLGMNIEPGRQVTYHLPLSMWDEVDFAVEFMHAPKWDGHTSADVLERLKKI